jgi:hypothetical protein
MRWVKAQKPFTNHRFEMGNCFGRAIDFKEEGGMILW